MQSFYGLVLPLLIVGVVSKELPSYIPICKRDSKTISHCLRMASVTLQPYISKGIKELNIPPLEPLEIPMLQLEQGTGAVNFKAALSKLKVYGLSNYVFKELNFDFDEKSANISGIIDFETIRLVADYKINGRVLLLPITGNGEFTANLTKTQANFVSHLGFVKKKGTDYLFRKNATNLTLKIGDSTVHLADLFNGDPVLTQTTNQFFNENFKEILSEIQPAIETVVSMLIDDILGLTLILTKTQLDPLTSQIYVTQVIQSA